MSYELGRHDRDAARRFLSALYSSADQASFVEMRFRVASGMSRRFHRAAAIERVAEAVVTLASRTDVYVGVVPRRRCGGARADLVERATVVWADCDGRESLVALEEFRPEPAMVVASGTDRNCQVYWFLRDPVDLDRIEQTNRRVASAIGADMQSTDAARILRPAGSMNRRHSPPRPVSLLRCRERERVAIAELERSLPRERFPSDSPGARPLPDGVLADPLRRLPPRLYVERLTGQRVGPSGKVLCPFHDDRTPSLHVYEDPLRGWYCFGCGRGGSIYDLAALLFGRGTRGDDFRELRRELTAFMR
jgi:hypothetical protein